MHFAARFGGRPLADQVDHATRGVFAIQDRSRAAEHFHPLQAVGFAAGVVAVALHPQAIAQQAIAVVGGIEATDEEQVTRLAIPAGKRRGENAWYIAQHLGEGLRLLVVHALAGYHRNRARGVGQGAAGFAGGGTGDGAVAAIALAVAGEQGSGVDRRGIQLQGGAIGKRLQHITRAALGHGLQAAAL
ncbi:hypothetical protein D3C76_1155020 [compost metagenome]